MGFSRQEYWIGVPFPSPMHKSEKWKWSCSVVSDSWQPHGLQPTRLLRPWDFPGKNTGMGCHCLFLCSLSEHVFCCALLTLWCACVNEWHALGEASKESCSAVPGWSYMAYGRNLSGVYTDLPVPRGTQCLLWELARNGQSVWTELSFLSQTFRSLWPFHNFLGIRSTNLIYHRLGS